MAIRVQNLVKNYGEHTIVHGISFDVADGEFVSLLGPSGCGKTTTLRCIAGLEEANGGEIVIDNQVVSSPSAGIQVPPHLRQIGMVFQSYAIWPHMTVFGNVAFPLQTQKLPAREIQERVEKALEIVGLRHLKDRRAPLLSGGQQQRVALARAIVQEPRVLLFDEPLSNLDAKLRDHTRGELKRLQTELRVSAIYVTHDQAEALSLSDRVIVMEAGRIAQEGTPRQLYFRPGTWFVADFVGAANCFEFTATRAVDGMLMGQAPDGSAIRVPAGPGAAPGRFRLVVRPERLQLAPRAAAAWGQGWNVVTGVIRQELFMGAYLEYLVDVGGTILRVFSPDPVTAELVAVAFRVDDCAVLPGGEKSGDDAADHAETAVNQ